MPYPTFHNLCVFVCSWNVAIYVLNSNIYKLFIHLGHQEGYMVQVQYVSLMFLLKQIRNMFGGQNGCHGWCQASVLSSWFPLSSDIIQDGCMKLSLCSPSLQLFPHNYLLAYIPFSSTSVPSYVMSDSPLYIFLSLCCLQIFPNRLSPRHCLLIIPDRGWSLSG